MTEMKTSVEEFVTKTRLLIAKERDAEIEETKLLQENVSPKELERRGVCLLRLNIAARHMGLYGRTVVQFEAAKEMPSHNLGPGDIVGLAPTSSVSAAELIGSGVVSRVTASSVSVAFDDLHDALIELDDSSQFKLIKLANDVTYRRMQRALDDLNSGRGNGELVNVLFDVSEISLPFDIQELTFFNNNLDESQKEAVKFALCRREVAIIHGPPGTGKTTTVTEVIRQAVKSGLKVLVCAPSNIAVDNLVEKLGSAGLARIVRLGHPARLLPTIQRYSLDAILASSEDTKLVEDVRTDINKTLAQLKRVRDRGERQRVRDDLKSLRRELRQRETTAVTDILRRASVVLATLTTVSNDGPLSSLGTELFDLVVIDECSQAMEAACWIALLRAKRCVLAGDHHQLPPTILSERAAKDGLAMTLMERLLLRKTNRGDQLPGPASPEVENQLVRMLTTQYRMHSDIMRWSSEQMYDGRLVAHPSVASHLLKDLPNVAETEDTCVPLMLIDTAGCNLNELDIVDGESKGNEGEADIVVMHVKNLIGAGLLPEDIAVIAPYNLQVELLRLRLSQNYPRLEIKSVDGFQGREKEAVVISLVRSNANGEVGFLTEDRRINVAVTRARRHLAVVCDTDTVSRHAFIKSLVDHITACGEVRSAEQYIQEGALQSDTKRPDELESRLRSAAQSATKGGKSAGGKTKKPTTNANNVAGNRTSASNQRPLDGDRKQTAKDLESHEGVREKFEKILRDFVDSRNQSTHVFPSSLTSHDRFVIHEISEQLGLVHLSVGDGADRHIEVRKLSGENQSSSGAGVKLTSVSTTAEKARPSGGTSSGDSARSQTKSVQPSTNLPDTEIPVTSVKASRHTAIGDSSSDAASQNGSVSAGCLAKPVAAASTAAPSLVHCPVCQKQIPETNVQLHSLRCGNYEATVAPSAGEPVAPESNVKKPGSSSRRKQKSKPTSDPAPATSAVAVDDDFDAIVDAAILDNKRCHMSRCKNSTATLGQLCAFCHRTFCLSHHLAEVHGCGDEAKRQARASIRREGAIYPGSGVPSKKPDAVRRAHLEHKLADRLGGLVDKRKKKPKDGKDK